MSRKIVVVLGATGAGKSKLALQVADLFNGEIISTDSMQIYKGLNIVTNKVTKEEQKEIPHHMLDFVCPLKSNFNILDFRNAAIPKIEDMFHRKKLPVIVGGTNYYIEALLWNFLIGKAPTEEQVDSHERSSKDDCNETSNSNNTNDKTAVKQKNLKIDSKDRSTKDLYSWLKKVDPVSAKAYHPHDRRKIIRALEVNDQHCTPLSEMLEMQHSADGASQISGALRFPDSCFVWVQCDQNVLDERTDKRVDEMVESGLLAEMEDFHKQYNQQRVNENGEADYEHGIFQSIGFKEFHPYLLLSEADQQATDGQKLFQKGIQDMKFATRRYARKQKKWITGRLLKRRGLLAIVPPVYGVDSSDKEKWQTNVHKPSCDIVRAFLNNEIPEQEPLPIEMNDNEKKQFMCEECDIVVCTTKDWQFHITGKRHKKRLESLRRKEKRKCQATTSDQDTSDLVKSKHKKTDTSTCTVEPALNC